MIHFRPLFYLFIFLIYPIVTVWAEIPPAPNPPKLVNDFGGMLSAGFANSLENELVKYEKETSTQITVVSVDTLDGYDIAQYGTELGQLWGVGSKKDNGVLILLAKQERRINISTGYGVEHLLTDVLSKQIIEDYMIPEFKKGNIDQGVMLGVQSVAQALQGEFVNDKKPAQSEKSLKSYLPILIMLVFFIIFVLRGRSIVGRRNRNISTPLLLGGLGGLGGMRGGRGFGGGGFGGGGFGGGGFGGFGGGGFGGGGASGGW